LLAGYLDDSLERIGDVYRRRVGEEDSGDRSGPV
jgi:hypothetical protein